MSKSVDSKGPVLEEIPDGIVRDGKAGKIGDKSVVKASKQTSKGWFILAIVIGSLVVIGAGGFGGTGLLQSHNLVSLPQWLTSAIGTVGNTPHVWSLWTMTAGGIVVGGGLIAFGAYKVHQARLNEKFVREQEKLEQFKEERMQEVKGLPKISTKDKLEGEFSKRPSMTSFGDNFKALGVQSESYQTLLSNGTYVVRHFGKWEGEGESRRFLPEARADKNFIVIKTHEGVVQCTNRITSQQEDKLVTFLRITNNYQAARPK